MIGVKAIKNSPSRHLGRHPREASVNVFPLQGTH